MNITFTNPEYLWLLIAVPFIVIGHFMTLRYTKRAALKFANYEAMARVSKGYLFGKPYRGILSNKNILLIFIRIIAYSLLILAITGSIFWYSGKVSSFDYVLAIDGSTSMLANDFEPNRIEVAKETALNFIEYVPRATNIGILSFSGTIFVEQEITEDKSIMKEVIENLRIKRAGGTNLGDSIITAANMLKSDGKGAIILITDGQSNSGTEINDAINYAIKKNIKIFTIGIGTEEGGNIAGVEFISDLDEDTLIKISDSTESNYYRAKTQEELDTAFKEIADIKTSKKSFNLSLVLVLTGLLILFLEEVLINTKYKTVP